MLESTEQKKKDSTRGVKKNRPKEIIKSKAKPRPFMRRIRVDKDREMQKS